MTETEVIAIMDRLKSSGKEIKVNEHGLVEGPGYWPAVGASADPDWRTALLNHTETLEKQLEGFRRQRQEYEALEKSYENALVIQGLIRKHLGRESQT